MLAWIPQTFDAACKRAAGRRRYHAQRRRARDKRQLTVMAVLVEVNWQSKRVTFRDGGIALRIRRIVLSDQQSAKVAKQALRLRSFPQVVGTFRFLEALHA